MLNYLSKVPCWLLNCKYPIVSPQTKSIHRCTWTKRYRLLTERRASLPTNPTLLKILMFTYIILSAKYSRHQLHRCIRLWSKQRDLQEHMTRKFKIEKRKQENIILQLRVFVESGQTRLVYESAFVILPFRLVFISTQLSEGYSSVQQQWLIYYLVWGKEHWSMYLEKKSFSVPHEVSFRTHPSEIFTINEIVT